MSWTAPAAPQAREPSPSNALLHAAVERLQQSHTNGIVSRSQDGITLERVWHTYQGQTGRVQALEPVDLTVPAGQFIAVLGPSGCGKTTLLRIMSGLLAPGGGRVLLGEGPPALARQRRAIGWLAQDDGLLPWRSVFDNVNLPLRLARKDQPGLVMDVLDRVGLAGSARQYPHELSGGMRQRVALARALVARPPFLLLDEPFAHLDELTRERLGDLLRELRTIDQRAPTTVLVTHSVFEAVRLAERVVVFSPRPGRLIEDVLVDLPYPRSEDQPRFGARVRQLKSALTEHQALTV
jgi:NitT/TauT family transport system ATP-binding protein